MNDKLEVPINFASLSPVQVVDVTITRIWISTRLWLACLSHAILEPYPDMDLLSTHFPLRMGVESVAAINLFPRDAFLDNGQSMVSLSHSCTVSIHIAA